VAIVTLAEAKLQLNIPAEDIRSDAELSTYLQALTPVVENTARRVVEQRDFSDLLDLDGALRFCLNNVPVTDLGAITKLDDGSDVDTGGFVFTGTGLVLVVNSGAPLSGLFQVDYTAGPDVVADNDKRGALVILQYNWELQRGVGNLSAMGAGESYPTLGFAVPNRAREWFGAPMPVLP
jgi:hypothetical protein